MVVLSMFDGGSSIILVNKYMNHYIYDVGNNFCNRNTNIGPHWMGHGDGMWYLILN
jgi:hypothetical protein